MKMVECFLSKLKQYSSGVIGPSDFFEDCCQLSNLLRPVQTPEIKEKTPDLSLSSDAVQKPAAEIKRPDVLFATDTTVQTQADLEEIKEKTPDVILAAETKVDPDNLKTAETKVDPDNLKTLMFTTLRDIEDPRQRAHLQLRYVVKFPAVKTQCCDYLHCFQCKVEGHPEGISCEDEEDILDGTIQQCPGCNISLVKGDGCSSIRCVCGEEFEWDEDDY
jgi:hypothetical protein